MVTMHWYGNLDTMFSTIQVSNKTSFIAPRETNIEAINPRF